MQYVKTEYVIYTDANSMLNSDAFQQIVKHYTDPIVGAVCGEKRIRTGIENETGSFKGAIYGANSNKMTSALKRHKNKSDKYPNMFFCGGTVHPGGGIPLVLRSAKIVDSYV